MTIPTPEICERLRNGGHCREAADLIQQQLATIERLSAALADCFAAACDYNLDERTHRNKITAIARAALGKDAK